MKILIIFLLILFSSSLALSSFAQDDEYRGTQKFLKSVGVEYDQEGKGFDIKYVLEGQLHNFILVDSFSNSVTFEYDSKGIEEDVLIIYLPNELIEEPIGVYVNGELERDSIRSIVGNITRMIIALYEDSKTITIVGTNVIAKEQSFEGEDQNGESKEIKTLYNVGAKYGGEGFEVDYILSTELDSEVKISPEDNTITFTIKGIIIENEELVFLALPEDLINEPILVEVDGVKEPESVRSIRGEVAKMTIPLKPGAKEISIKGVSVIPEFGVIAPLVLVISIISIIILTSAKKMPRFYLR